MTSTPPRILLIGVGSIGGTLAGHLLARGHRLALVTGNPAITAALNADGLHMESLHGPLRVAAPAATRLADLDPALRFDYVFLATMIGAVEDAARTARSRLAPAGVVVSFQNGVVDELVARAAGAVPLVCVSVAYGASMVAPGRYRMNSGGSMVVGTRAGVVTGAVRTLADLLAAVVDTRISRNIIGVLWGKLAWNCAVSGLCTAAGCALGELVRSARGQRLFLHALREVRDTAQACGVAVEPVVIDLEDYYLPLDAAPALTALRMDAVAALAGPYAAVRPSALQSIERGRPSEIPWLNGYLVAQAERHGIAVPLNAALTAMIADIEAGRRTFGPHNLALLEASVQASAR